MAHHWLATMVAGSLMAMTLSSCGGSAMPTNGEPCDSPGESRDIAEGTLLCNDTPTGRVWQIVGADGRPVATTIAPQSASEADLLIYSPNAIASLERFPQPLTHSCRPEGDQAQYQWYRTDRTLVIDPRNTSRLLVGVERLGIFESFDGGETWQPISTTGIVFDLAKPDGTACTKEMFEIVFDPFVKGRIYLFFGGTGTVETGEWQSRGSGFYVSNDDGQTWTLLTSPKMNAYTNSLAIDPFDPDVIYAGTAAIPATNSEADPNTVWVNDGMIYRIEGVLKGGTSWKELPTGWGKATRANTIWADPAIRGRLVLGVFSSPRNAPSGTGLLPGWYESLDGGNTWASMGSGVGHDTSVVNPAISPDGSRLINHTQSEQGDFTLVSTDGARTWKRLAEPILNAVYDPHGAGTGAYGIRDVAVSEGQNPFVRSEDGGLTWKTIGYLPESFKSNRYNEAPTYRQAMPSKIVPHPTDPSILYVAGAAGMIARSTDSGATWTMLTTWEDFPPFSVRAR